MMRCACDACDRIGADSGYCEFCSRNCYPESTMGGRPVHVAMSRDSRVSMHRGTHDLQERIAKVAVARLEPIVRGGIDHALDVLKRRILGGRR